MNSVASHKYLGRTQLSVVLLAGTMLATPLMAQEVAPPRVPAPTVPAPAPEAVPAATTVQSITVVGNQRLEAQTMRSEEHTSEPQSLMRISYAVIFVTQKTNHRGDNTVDI